jgi:hypothetical protein
MESHFLRKTRESLARNLALAENLMDFLYGSGLLSMYFYSVLNYPQAHRESYGKSSFPLTLFYERIYARH